MTDVTGSGPVVAGVDGSTHSLDALDLAATEAARRGLPLEIVHGYVSPVTYPPLDAAPEVTEPALHAHAEQLLHEAAARVRAAHPGLAVITRLHDGQPAAVLEAASRQATLVVVGHRGLGGFAGLLAGSVGVQLASHAACPVIVVRGEPAATDSEPVVVGVDGSAGSRRAAAFAIDVAARYGVPLVALHAWPVDAAWPPALAQSGYPPPQAPDVAADTLGDLPDRYPRVKVQPEVRQHVPAHQALLAASERAKLVVVGSRGRGGFRGLLLGSVSQALIHHAHCPVAVVGEQTRGAADEG